MWEIIACGIQNLEILLLESGIQLKEFGILLTIGIRNPRSTEKESGYLESGIHGVESRIQECLGFPYEAILCNTDEV